MQLMSTKAKIYDYIFFYFIATLYSYSLSRAIIIATILEVSESRTLLLCAGFILMFFVILYNRYTILSTLGLVLGAGIVLYFYLRSQGFQVQWFLELQGFYRQLKQFAYNLIPHQAAYSVVLGALISLFVTWLVSLNTVGYFNFPALSLFGLGVFLIPSSMGWKHSDRTAFLFIFCVIALLFKQMNLYAAGEESGESKANAKFGLVAIPASVAVLLVATVIPRPDQLLQGIGGPHFLRDAADNLIYEVGGSSVKTFSDPGSTLGGPVQLGNEFIMEVTVDERIYLSGSIRDEYTGTSWEISNNKMEPLPGEFGIYGTAEYSEELLDAQLYYMNYYGRNIKTVVTDFKENRLKAVLTPPFAIDLRLPDGFVPERNSLGSVQLNKPFDRYASYSQNYISWDFDSEYLVHYLLRGEGESILRQGLDEDLQQYLELPKNLPQRVYDLAEEQTAGLSSNYDKIKALEAYIKQFPYTLSPDETPRGEDFVDHFLFEEKQGYCVYHASALAVLSRCVGIPTRYVEGYALPEQRNENGTFTVTSSCAHAWTEAYFPGFGWVPFEAVPASHISQLGQLAEETPEPVPEQSVSAPEPTEEPDATPESVPPDRQENLEHTDTSQPGAQTESIDLKLIPVVLITVALIGFLVVAFVHLMKKYYYHRCKRLEHVSNAKAVQAYFSRILKAAKTIGLPMHKNETAYAYASRVEERFPFLSDATDIRTLAEIYCKATYSLNEISENERTVLQEAYGDLMDYLEQQIMSKPVFYIKRYVLMRF